MPGTLYLVATPIGNLQDISFRAVDTLKSVDLIACEDTRHTRKLLNAFEIKNKLVSYHEHNEAERADELGKMLESGKSIAVVSDAGTPGINDPGFRLVQKAREIGSDVVPVPGAVAFVNAVVASGLPTDAIFFCGFLPSKRGERRKRLDELKFIPATLVFYEAPRRIVNTLSDCIDIFGNRRASIAREITKLHEEIITSDLISLSERFSASNSKGEFVLVIAGERLDEDVPQKGRLTDRIIELENEGLDRKTALKKAAKESGLSKSEAYRILQSER